LRWQPETDSNYSSLFSFWDRLFGTFRWRLNLSTLQYGLEEFDLPEHHTLIGLFTTPAKQVRRKTPGAQRQNDESRGR
jgi:sterol desaturase/sphingolipid hydroxylase (fatty acid hydroxylase superfamily)